MTMTDASLLFQAYQLHWAPLCWKSSFAGPVSFPVHLDHVAAIAAVVAVEFVPTAAAVALLAPHREPHAMDS